MNPARIPIPATAQPTARFLIAAAVLAVVHDVFREWALYPQVALWREDAFWASLPAAPCIPLAHGLFWALASAGRINPARPILAAAAILCLGDLLSLLLWLNIQALGFESGKWVGYWDWWGCWLPAILLCGNLYLARQWWKIFSRRAVAPASPVAPLDRALKSTAMLLGGSAALVSGIHLLAPAMPVNDLSLSLADLFLVEDPWRKDFDFVVRNAPIRGKRLGAVLEHPELAHLQRHHFYAELDEAMYQQFILSPLVDSLPLSELDWRRTLWEGFYPRIRNEHDPLQAARAVVRFLRGQVGVDPASSSRVGVETIWTRQMTDEQGFARIHVAALRSVGIAARLNTQGLAELWTGTAWKDAPRSMLAGWAISPATTP